MKHLSSTRTMMNKLFMEFFIFCVVIRMLGSKLLFISTLRRSPSTSPTTVYFMPHLIICSLLTFVIKQFLNNTHKTIKPISESRISPFKYISFNHNVQIRSYAKKKVLKKKKGKTPSIEDFFGEEGLSLQPDKEPQAVAKSFTFEMHGRRIADPYHYMKAVTGHQVCLVILLRLKESNCCRILKNTLFMRKIISIISRTLLSPLYHMCLAM